MIRVIASLTKYSIVSIHIGFALFSIEMVKREVIPIAIREDMVQRMKNVAFQYTIQNRIHSNHTVWIARMNVVGSN